MSSMIPIDEIDFEMPDPSEVGRRLGVEMTEELGMGDDGTVYALADGRALKLTSSRIEAAIALALSGESPHVGLPEFHGVWRIRGAMTWPGGSREYTRYAILRNRMEDVCAPDKDVWFEAVHDLNEGWRTGDWEFQKKGLMAAQGCWRSFRP